MVFKVQQSYHHKYIEDSYDRMHWLENGWLDKKTTYYQPLKGGRLKIAAARAVGTLVALFFI